ncbi:hypothetical protein PG985_000825 [Apiospora marii]|uniref:uncharacterized protein n=1 Tax=Apiospora marii TaxID=335849 RepID=UPI003131E0E4
MDGVEGSQPPSTTQEQRSIRQRVKRAMRDPLTRHLALEVVRLKKEISKRDERIGEQDACVAKQNELLHRI